MAMTKTTTFHSVGVDLQMGYLHITYSVVVDDPDDDQLPMEVRKNDSVYCHGDFTAYPESIGAIADAIKAGYPEEMPVGAIAGGA